MHIYIIYIFDKKLSLKGTCCNILLPLSRRIVTLAITSRAHAIPIIAALAAFPFPIVFLSSAKKKLKNKVVSK